MIHDLTQRAPKQENVYDFYKQEYKKININKNKQKMQKDYLFKAINAA